MMHTGHSHSLQNFHPFVDVGMYCTESVVIVDSQCGDTHCQAVAALETACSTTVIAPAPRRRPRGCIGRIIPCSRSTIRHEFPSGIYQWCQTLQVPRELPFATLFVVMFFLRRLLCGSGLRWLAFTHCQGQLYFSEGTEALKRRYLRYSY